MDQDIFDDKEINTVFITTRHNLHYSQIIKSLESGKHVFVEKPITLKEDEFNQLCSKYENINKDQKNKLKIMIGYNRRFSPLTKLTKNLLNSYQAKKYLLDMIYMPDKYLMTIGSEILKLEEGGF